VLLGAAVLITGLALVCCPESDLLLEQAENPTAAIAARPTASFLPEYLSFRFGSFDFFVSGGWRH
jgi:hypothetical protein